MELTLAHVEAERERRKRNKIESFFPDEGPYRRELYPKHMEFFAAGAIHRERLFLAGNRVGKALKHGTKVATPNGWTAIEELKVGDLVIAGDGSQTRVVGVYPQGVKPMLKLTFDVGEEIECCPEHLWLYQHPRARFATRWSHSGEEANPFYGEWMVANTKTILSEVGHKPNAKHRVVIPTSKPWQMGENPVDLCPYLVGLLIGDGGLTDYVRITTADEEILSHVRSCLPADVRLVACGGNYDYAISGQNGGDASVRTGNAVRDSLIKLGLYGKGAADKFIPDAYKFNTPEVRLAVLQGLCDTDGSIGRTGAMEFSSISRRLVEDVQFLVHSLGGKCAISSRQTHFTHNGIRKAGAPSFRARIRLNVCPFRLTRKAERWNSRKNTNNRVLHSIEPSAAAECTCIEVAHPSHTYVIEYGIVTHNTEAGAYEITCHMTGKYPHWWTGKRFPKAQNWWIAGDTSKTVRDIQQFKLLGPPGGFGTGMIPGSLLGPTKPKQGIPDAVESFYVKHVTGDYSTGMFKSYDQRREAFQGTEMEGGIWLDEECPMDIHTECLTRLMTTEGLLILTFTPLSGWTEVVDSFLKKEAA